MYIVKEYHTRPCHRNGDLECETVMLSADVYRTRKTAKAYIERQLSKYQMVTRKYHVGDVQSTCYAFTGKSWTHENSGEICNECYTYTIDKVDPK